MGSRTQLQALLEGIVSNVYFQAPGAQAMVYPCIVYKRVVGDAKYADSIQYFGKRAYEVTLISRSPDDPAVASLQNMQFCSHTRTFVYTNLHHDTFKLYY